MYMHYVGDKDCFARPTYKPMAIMMECVIAQNSDNV